MQVMSTLRIPCIINTGLVGFEKKYVLYSKSHTQIHALFFACAYNSTPQWLLSLNQPTVA